MKPEASSAGDMRLSGGISFDVFSWDMGWRRIGTDERQHHHLGLNLKYLRISSNLTVN